MLCFGGSIVPGHQKKTFGIERLRHAVGWRKKMDGQQRINPGKLRFWIPKMEVWKMMFLFNYVNSQVPAVNFPGCSGCLQHPRSEGKGRKWFSAFYWFELGENAASFGTQRGLYWKGRSRIIQSFQETGIICNKPSIFYFLFLSKDFPTHQKSPQKRGGHVSIAKKQFTRPR